MFLRRTEERVPSLCLKTPPESSPVRTLPELLDLVLEAASPQLLPAPFTWPKLIPKHPISILRLFPVPIIKGKDGAPLGQGTPPTSTQFRVLPRLLKCLLLLLLLALFSFSIEYVLKGTSTAVPFFCKRHLLPKRVIRC